MIRRSLAEWSRECGYEPARHHQLLIDTLEAAVRRERRRILFTLPPNSAKSTYSSVLFPAWVPGLMKRGEKLLACSHNFDLVQSFGRTARNLIVEKSHILGYSIKPTTKAADNWETTGGVEYRAAGCGAGISGMRAAIGLIDDPIGSKEDADSELFRSKLWNWYVWEFRKRVDPNGVIIIIQTRWHEDDLAGKLIAEEGLIEDGGEWTLINVPLIAVDNDPIGRQPGEPLWPERFNEQHIKDARKDARAFSCLEQGDPEPVEGNHFKAETLLEYHMAELPRELRYYVTSDHALDTKEVNDRTCLLPFGIDENKHIWILPDVFWDRCDTGVTVRQMLEMMKRRQPVTWWAENDNIKKSIGPFLAEKMLEEQVFCSVEGVQAVRDKVQRSQSILGRMSALTVHFPVEAHWWPAARKEVLAFPAGKHDDFVDALSLVGLGLGRLVKATKPAVERIVAPLTYGWVRNLHRQSETQKRIKALDR